MPLNIVNVLRLDFILFVVRAFGDTYDNLQYIAELMQQDRQLSQSYLQFKVNIWAI